MTKLCFLQLQVASKVFKVTTRKPGVKEPRVYEVNITVPRCSCYSWIEHHVPCCHMVELFKQDCEYCTYYYIFN